MAVSKNGKHPKQANTPAGRRIQSFDPNPQITSREEPSSIMQKNPSWRFALCDSDVSSNWAFHKERLQSEFWTHILPKLQQFETMTWGQLLVESRKQNHSNAVESMNKVAKDRLAELEIEEESLVSLRLNGTCRLYGFMVDSAYCIVWYDNDHGDNDRCVYRSRMRHT